MKSKKTSLKVAIIGEGAIASGLLELLQNDAAVQVIGLIINDLANSSSPARKLLPQQAQIVTQLSALAHRPDLVIECAGHAALVEHVIPALAHGIPCVVVSIGALSDTTVSHGLEEAARTGSSHVYLMPGAVGGIDALAAAKLGGLSEVTYVGRKPPNAWHGTPAEREFDLSSLSAATSIFKGTARQAAALYPKNANVAATVALAGMGMDATMVELLADPAVTQNVHAITASGTFGQFEIILRGAPLAANPKTSALTVYSVARAVRNIAHSVSL